MCDDLGVGLAGEFRPVLGQAVAEFAEVLDDAVVHHGDFVRGVRMGVALRRPAVRRPAGVADADRAAERLLAEPVLQRLELALGAAAAERTVVQCGDAGGVVAAVFEALERIDEMFGDRLGPENSNDPAHPRGRPR